MKQTVTASVYQNGNTLIAISDVLDTDNSGDALCTRKASLTVITGAENELAVRHILINHTSRDIPNVGNNYSVLPPMLTLLKSQI